ncbi:acyl-CoA Delta-9 desaturase [Prorops nasuta]|uniref:acyl-CoA Delta-9 desaturase n=1 Tax=Prorops nasuta TaxID=863751 RepID=UPI0034CDBCA1
MAPNITAASICLQEKLEKQHLKYQKIAESLDENNNTITRYDGDKRKLSKFATNFGFKTELIWYNIFHIFLLHLFCVYCFLTFNYLENWKTTLWLFLMFVPPGFGVTGGVHRYWTHRSYKAKWPLRMILMLCYQTAGQNTIYDWVRDHRVHHKYSETDADPHNSNRGFFFAHVGWLMMKKHPEVIKKGQKIDMSDVLADPVVIFSQKYFTILKILFAFVLPTIIPVYGWRETWARAIISQCLIRYPITLNSTWSVNSAAHLWGTKPYDRYINPVENRAVALVAFGEGWHNYHHAFPWDYKAAELGNYRLNITTGLIDMFSKIGWAYDLRRASNELVKSVVANKGDGSHPIWSEVPDPSNELIVQKD